MLINFNFCFLGQMIGSMWVYARPRVGAFPSPFVVLSSGLRVASRRAVHTPQLYYLYVNRFYHLDHLRCLYEEFMIYKITYLIFPKLN